MWAKRCHGSPQGQGRTLLGRYGRRQAQIREQGMKFQVWLGAIGPGLIPLRASEDSTPRKFALVSILLLAMGCSGTSTLV
jgi:hypothetical protein